MEENNYQQLECLKLAETEQSVPNTAAVSKAANSVRRMLVPLLTAMATVGAVKAANAETTAVPENRNMRISCEGDLTRNPGNNDFTCKLSPYQEPVVGVTFVGQNDCKDLIDQTSVQAATDGTTVSAPKCVAMTNRYSSLNQGDKYLTYTVSQAPNAEVGANGVANVKFGNDNYSVAIDQPARPINAGEAVAIFDQEFDRRKPELTPVMPEQSPQSYQLEQPSNNWFNFKGGYQVEYGDFQVDRTQGYILGTGMNFPFDETSDWYYGGELKFTDANAHMELHNIATVDPVSDQNIKRVEIGPNVTYMPGSFGLTLGASLGLSVINTDESTIRRDDYTWKLTPQEQKKPFIGLHFGPQLHLGPFVFGGEVGGVITPGGNEIPADSKQGAVFTLGAFAGVQNK